MNIILYEMGDKMRTIEVNTKEELKQAMNDKYDEIIVNGELAKKLNKAKKINKLSKVTLGILIAALTAGIATAPITGGASLGASFITAAPIAALTGTDIAVIIAVSFIGVTLVIAVFKDYDDVEFSTNPLKLKLKRK